MKTVLVALSLVLAFGLSCHAEIIYSVDDTYVETRQKTPHVYDWHIGGETCAATVLSGKLVSVVCRETGQEMMLYMSGNSVVVSRKGGATKKYARGKVAYGMYQAIIEHAKENGTVVTLK